MNILSRLQERNLIFSAFVAVVVFFFLAHRLFVKTPGRLESIASCCVYPFLAVQHRVISPVQSLFAKKQNLADLQKRITELEDEKQTLQGRVTQLESLKFFSEQTNQMQKFEHRYDTQNLQLSHIVMRRFTNTEQVFFVDAGSKHGIHKDMVAVFKNSIVGKVDQVYPYYSRVMSVADKRCKIAAYCSVTKTQGIFEGTNSQDIASLAHVDRLKKLRAKENIISSGEGTVFPRGFLLGTLESFEPQGMHHHVTAKPAVDLQKLEYCYLIQKGKEQS